MKYILLAILALVLAAGCAKNDGYQVKSHHIRLKTQPYTQRLSAIDSIQLVYQKPTEYIHFVLGTDFSVDAARVGHQELEVTEIQPDDMTSPGFQKKAGDKSRLYRITLPKSLHPRHIEIRYHGSIENARLCDGKTDYGSLLTPDLFWYPQFLQSLSRFTLKAQSDYYPQAASCGTVLGHKDSLFGVWRSQKPITSLFYLTGKFHITEQKYNGTHITVYKPVTSDFPSVSFAAKASFLLDDFAGKFGEYPFSGFCIVEDDAEKDMFIPSLSIIPPQLACSPAADMILRRDICASWWGNSVVPPAKQGNWVEGLVTYCGEYQPIEERSPELAQKFRYKLLTEYYSANFNKEYPLDRFQKIQSPQDSAVGRAKAAMLFYQLEQMIGPDNMQSALKQIYSSYAHRAAGWSDFQAVFEQVSGEDLSFFFHQWLHQKGAPQLGVHNVVSQKQNGSYKLCFTLEQEQTCSNYDLDIPVKMSTFDGVMYDSCKMDKKQQKYCIVTENPVEKLEIDPDYKIFRRLHPDEFSPSLKQFQLYPEKLVICGSPRSRELLDFIFVAEQCPVISYQDIPRYRLGDYAILAVDIDNEKLFELGYIHSDSIRYATDRVTVYNETFKGNDDCIVFAMLNKKNPHLPVIGVWYKTEKALEKIVRPIEKFGEYGFVVFRNGQNILTGNWDTQNNPLSIDL